MLSVMKDNQSHMMNLNRNYAAPWGNMLPPPPPSSLTDDPMKFVKNYPRHGFGGGRGNWKGKRGKKGVVVVGNGNVNVGGSGGVASGGGMYKPPGLHELQSQNRMKAKRFYPKKKFNNRFAPCAPRNTSSFIIRAKKSGGIASFVSPYPATPAVLPTPVFSPSNEVLGDMAKEEWGVNGYGSMNGLIRLRSPGNEIDEEEEGGDGSSGSDVEEHVEVERRLDHDLSRFEMIYPNSGDDNGNGTMFEDQMEEQDVHVVQLEEENLTLRERLFLMERELVELKMRMQCLEAESRANKEKNFVLVVNKSDNMKEDSKDGNMEKGSCSLDENLVKDEANKASVTLENTAGTLENIENNDEHDENDSSSLDEKDEMNEDSENEGVGNAPSEKSFCDSHRTDLRRHLSMEFQRDVRNRKDFR